MNPPSADGGCLHDSLLINQNQPPILMSERRNLPHITGGFSSFPLTLAGHERPRLEADFGHSGRLVRIKRLCGIDVRSESESVKLIRFDRRIDCALKNRIDR